MRDVTLYYPAILFAEWPRTPTVCSYIICPLEPDALTYYDEEQDMAYVIHRWPYRALGDPRDVVGLVKERLAWPAAWLDEAAKADCQDFLTDAAWRAGNASYLWGRPMGNGLTAWISAESTRARMLRATMQAAHVGHVTELWRGKG